MARLTFWTAKRRKRLAALAAKGSAASQIAPLLSEPWHALTAEAVRKAAALFGIPLLHPGGRPFANPGRGRPRKGEGGRRPKAKPGTGRGRPLRRRTAR